MFFSMIGHHKKTLDDAAKKSIERAVGIHQLAAIGFMVLAYNDAPLVPLCMLSVATVLFPGLIYY